MKKIVGILLSLWVTCLVAQKKTESPLKNIDTVVFKKQQIPTSKKVTYNSTKYELQKFHAFRIRTSKVKDEKKYLSEIHSFTKDSLQILSVKLLSIKELNNKKLLSKDVSLNTTYYLDLLTELKRSDIKPTEYAFLEDKLALIIKKEIEQKYAVSKWINIILGGIVLCLLAFVYTLKRGKSTLETVALSKQETTIRNLILQGKSNKEIADELFISLSTVKTHITNLYHKLNVSNRNELTLKFKN